MKNIKFSLLTLLLLFFSFTIVDAAEDFDCGCSKALPSGNNMSIGYYSVNGDCCEQDGNSEISITGENGESIVVYDSPVDSSESCYGC